MAQMIVAGPLQELELSDEHVEIEIPHPWCRAPGEAQPESIVQVVTMQQLPADLLISITPGIRRLVEAAAPGAK